MTSPDVTPYVDLTIFDASSQQIFLDAIDYAKVALPEYAPQDGSIETVLLQAMALETQEAIYSINRLPGAVVEVLLRLLDVDRNSGTSATVVVKFIGSTTANFTVPLGARLYYQESPSADVLLLETTEQIIGTQAKTISTISQLSTTITVTTSTRHGLSTGNLVTISGTVAMNISNTAITIDPDDPTVFTLTAGGSGTYSETTGTVTPALTIPATGFVTAKTSEITEDFNGLAAGTDLILLSILPEIASVETASILTGGANAETDTEYFSRAVATLSRLSTALVTTTQMNQFVVESGRYSDAYRAYAVDNTDETREGSQINKVMIAVAPVDASVDNLLDGIGDGSIDSTDVNYGVKDIIYEGIAERVHAALDPVVVNPVIVELGVAATVKLPSGILASSVQDACDETLSTYLSSNTWDWSDVVRYNEVITQLRNTTVAVGTSTSAAVDYVSSITMTPTDAYIPDESTLYQVTNFARTGTTCTLTIGGPGIGGVHDLDLIAGESLWVKVVGMGNSAFNTTTIVQALTPTSSTITYTQGTGTIVSTGTATMTIASPCVVTLTNHGFVAGDAIYFTTTGALPTGLSASTVYYVQNPGAGTFNLNTTQSNAIANSSTGRIITSGTQSGTHTVIYYPLPTSGCILPMKRDANGNFTIYDPAPLVTSGTHTITTV